MKGKWLRRKANRVVSVIKSIVVRTPWVVRRFFVRLVVRDKEISIISNNCWAGRVYQYLGMPYLSPTAGLYFFAEDYIRFVSDLKYYLESELVFIEPEESRFYDSLQRNNQLDVPIGRINDVEIVFLHYPTKEEAKEKWDRRKARVNYDKLLFKFSRMNYCNDEHMKKFCESPLKNKVFLNNQKPIKYPCEVYYKTDYDHELYRDTEPFPGKIPLTKILRLK